MVIFFYFGNVNINKLKNCIVYIYIYIYVCVCVCVCVCVSMYVYICIYIYIYIYIFHVIMVFYISLLSWSNINTLCTVVDREGFSVFIVGHLCNKTQ